eukprot:4438936-Prymnesium_polylepis.1
MRSAQTATDGEPVVRSNDHLAPIVCSCAHDCDAKLAGCTAAASARTSRRLSGQSRRAPSGVRPTCSRAVAQMRSSITTTYFEAVVRSSDHLARVVFSCAYDCDAKLTGCTAAATARTSPGG